jgi:hypothetical protein
MKSSHDESPTGSVWFGSKWNPQEQLSNRSIFGYLEFHGLSLKRRISLCHVDELGRPNV